MGGGMKARASPVRAVRVRRRMRGRSSQRKFRAIR
jgi:hypothetical protein